MKNRLVIYLLSAVFLLSLTACSKDDAEAGTYNPQDPSAGSATNANGENMDAWWQQYTTEPHLNDGGSANNSVTNGNSSTTNGSGGSNSSSTTKAGSQNQPTSSRTTTKVVTAPAEDYVKVDNNTMKYDVKNGNEKGVVTLTKSGSNKFIKESLDSINKTFSSNFSASNTMCFSSTLKNMKDTTLVYVFSGSKKDASTLRFVVQFKGDKPESFGKISIDGNDAPLNYWPCAASGDSVYTEYLNTFKQVSGEYYSIGTETYKDLLKDECVSTFLSWK